MSHAASMSLLPLLPSYVTPEYLAHLELISGIGDGTDGCRCAVQEVRSWLGLDASSYDVPPCVSPVIGAFVIGLNDASERTRAALNERLPKMLGTAATPEIEHARSLRVLDWYLREWLPAWFDLAESLAPHAKALRAMEAVADHNASAAGVVVRAAGDAAGAAAGDAAGAAAGDAAWDAAWGAAWAAAGAAAGAAARAAAGAAAGAAAWDAAGAAAGTAAGDAAGTAAGDAAWAAAKARLAPTVERLQDSAIALLDELIAWTS